MTKENKEKILIGLFLITATMIGMLLVLWFNSRFLEKKPTDNVATTTEQNNQATTSQNIPVDIQPEKPIEQPKVLTDLEKYNSYNKVSIYPDGLVTPSDYVANAKNALKKAGRRIKITGQVADAYVYIKAGANDQFGKFTSIMNAYDGVWFYLQNGQFLGGQLDLSKSIYGQPSNLTELLYNLKNIPVAKNKDEYRQGKYQNKNLLSELKGDRTAGGIVSTQRYGKIEELTIGYKCADNSDCKIELK